MAANDLYLVREKSGGGYEFVSHSILSVMSTSLIEQRNSTTAQTFNIYGTYTDSSNYVRAALSCSTTSVSLATQTAGTGADDISLVFTLAGNGSVSCSNGDGLLFKATPSNNSSFGRQAITTVSGSGNSGFGAGSLYQIGGGGTNSAFGLNAMTNATSGDNNVAIGGYCRGGAASGSNNTAVGRSALYTSTGSGNVAIGYIAGAYYTGSDAFFVDNRDRGSADLEKGGSLIYGLFNATVASQIVNINGILNITGGLYTDASNYERVSLKITTGTVTLAAETAGTGADDISIVLSPAGAGLIGINGSTSSYPALKRSTTSLLVKLADDSGYTDIDVKRVMLSASVALHNTGTNNIFCGVSAGNATLSGNSNCSLGVGALVGLTSGVGNVGVGRQVGNGTTTASYLVAVGYQAAYALVSGDTNIAIGQYALYGTVTTAMGANNIAIGTGALICGCSGGENIAIGQNALGASVGVTGNRNICIGPYSGRLTTSAQYNIGIGYTSLYSVTTGASNVAIGRNALYSLVSGGVNVAVGDYALYQATGDYCIGIGYNAGVNIGSGSYNFGLGSQSLSSGASLITGSRNLGIGFGAGTYIAGAAQDNVCIGDNSAGTLTTGSKNVFIGAQSGYSSSVTTGTGNVFIGYRAGYSAGNTTDLFQVSNYDSGTLIAGDFATGRLNVGWVTSNTVIATLAAYVKTSTYLGLVVKAAASQSADLLQIQNSSGTVIALIDSAGKIGAGAATATSTLYSAGSFGVGVVNKTANYTATASDCIILCDSSSSAFTITLPTAASITGREYIIKDWKGTSGTFNITIDANGSEKIDGALTYTINTAYSSLTIVSDGTNWSIV